MEKEGWKHGKSNSAHAVHNGSILESFVTRIMNSPAPQSMSMEIVRDHVQFTWLSGFFRRIKTAKAKLSSVAARDIIANTFMTKTG